MSMMASEDSGDHSLLNILELIRLGDIGVSKKHCTWCRVTLTSDSHICIRHRIPSKDNNPEADEILVLSLKDCDESDSQQVALLKRADCAAVSPPDDGNKAPGFKLAYQHSDCIYVVYLNQTQKLIGQTRVTGLRFWSWVNHDVIALVTQDVVFHWCIQHDIDTEPQPVFEVDFGLSEAEIVSYKADKDMTWLALTGLVSETGAVSAVTQLYHCSKEISHSIIGHAALFTSIAQPQGVRHPVFCTACRDTETRNLGKVHVIPLGKERDDCDDIPAAKTIIITFPEDSAQYDFPVALQASSEAGILYVLTKYGFVYVCDIETAQCLCRAPISSEVVFTSAFNEDTNGVLAINRSGQVLQVQLKSKALADHVEHKLKKPDVAKRLSLHLQPPDDLDP